MTRDTIPAAPITEIDPAPTGKIKRPDPLEECVVVVDYLRGEVRGLTSAVANLEAAVERLSRAHAHARPSWADDILEAVALIAPSKAMAAEVVALRERVAEIDARCDGRHDRDPVPLLVPSNGHGGG